MKKILLLFRSPNDRRAAGSTSVTLGTTEVDYSLLGQFTSESWFNTSLLDNTDAFVF